MKAMILAAGLGTRLKPWTDFHPKALAPVGDIPMLKHVVEKLHSINITDITVNIHHFGEQIIDFLHKENLTDIHISDERDNLLDTGGGIVKAAKYLCRDDSPILVHNADILSNADLQSLIEQHLKMKSDITLLVSRRNSSRKLIFDSDMRLAGWKNISTGEIRPSVINEFPDSFKTFAFSGIYVLNTKCIDFMKNWSRTDKFPIMDFFLSHLDSLIINGVYQDNLNLIDIGKPDSWAEANSLTNS